MSTAVIERRQHYLNIHYGIRSWLLTTDHKRIAWLYLLSVTFFFFIGGFFSPLICFGFFTPQGGFVQAETYKKIFFIHGVTMGFFFFISSITAAFLGFFFSCFFLPPPP